MMASASRFSRMGFLVLLATAATGCASVKVSMPGFGSEEPTLSSAKSERLALASASEALADNPWNDSEGGSAMLSVLFGKGAQSDRESAVDAYIAALPGSKRDKTNAVMADADHAMAQARRVAEAGRQAVQSITPRNSDIDMLEGAIGNVRECRTMYVRALETLSDSGAPITRAEIRTVRDAFTQTISDIGHTADIVAKRVREGEGDTRVASPRRSTELTAQ